MDYITANWSWWRKKGFIWLKKELRGLAPGSTVLDVGAGEGKYAELFGEFNHQTVDFSLYPGVKVVRDVTQEPPGPPNNADALVLANALEHIKEPEAALRNCCVALKPGGTILITVPMTIKLHQAPHDYLRYTHFMLRYLLEKAGFTNVEIEEVGGIVEVKDSILNNYIGTLYHNSHSLSVKLGTRLLKVIFACLDPKIKTRIENNYWILGYHAKAIKK